MLLVGLKLGRAEGQSLIDGWYEGWRVGFVELDGALEGIELGAADVDGFVLGSAEGDVDKEGSSLACSVGFDDVVGWQNQKLISNDDSRYQRRVETEKLAKV